MKPTDDDPHELTRPRMPDVAMYLGDAVNHFVLSPSTETADYVARVLVAQATGIVRFTQYSERQRMAQLLDGVSADMLAARRHWPAVGTGSAFPRIAAALGTGRGAAAVAMD